MVLPLRKADVSVVVRVDKGQSKDTIMVFVVLTNDEISTVLSVRFDSVLSKKHIVMLGV